MATNHRYDPNYNGAVLIVLKEYFPELLDGFVRYIHENKMGELPDTDLPEVVGKYAVNGGVLVDYLESVGARKKVHKTLQLLVYGDRNLKFAREINSKIDSHLKRNKPFANKILLEAFVASSASPLLQNVVNNQGKVKSRFMMQLGAALGFGENHLRDSVFMRVYTAMKAERYKRRNRNDDVRTGGIGSLEFSATLSKNVFNYMANRGLSMASPAADFIKSVVDKVGNKLKAAAVVGVVVFGSTASLDNRVDIERILDSPSLTAATQEFASKINSLDLSTLGAKEYRSASEQSQGVNVDLMPDLELMTDEGDQLTLTQMAQHEQNAYDSERSVVVAAGDTLSGISQDVVEATYGYLLAVLTESEYQQLIHKTNLALAEYNGLENPNKIFPDQKIQIPENQLEVAKMGEQAKLGYLIEHLSGDESPTPRPLKMKF